MLLLFFNEQYSLHKEYAEKIVKGNPSSPIGYYRLGMDRLISGDFSETIRLTQKALELSPLDPSVHIWHISIGLANLGLQEFNSSLKIFDSLIAKSKAGNLICFKAANLAYLDRIDEAKEYLAAYLNMRPNLRTSRDFRKLFWGDSEITTIVLNGLLKAGWTPEN